jgi:hypothetical protein
MIIIRQHSRETTPRRYSLNPADSLSYFRPLKGTTPKRETTHLLKAGKLQQRLFLIPSFKTRMIRRLS